MSAQLPQTVVYDPGFLQQVEQESGVKVSACFQCRKCSAGCPLTYAMDLYPDRVIRLVQLGLRQQAIGSQTIWVCASCETCLTRCPNEVDIPKLMDHLKQVALRERVPLPPAEKNIAAMHRIFLNNIKKWGRIHELGVMGQYKRHTGDLFSDVGLGWRMFRMGRLKVLPSRIKGMREVRRMFSAPAPRA
jgi:heterodisulfide reductase subunit C